MTQAFRMSGGWVVIGASSAFDWLSQKPWGGNTTWWEIILTVAGVFAGTFFGGTALVVARTRAEARREFYFGLADEVKYPPYTVPACAPWLSACDRLFRVSTVLSYAERQGLRTLRALLPYQADNPELSEKVPWEDFVRSLSYPMAVRVGRVAYETREGPEIVDPVEKQLRTSFDKEHGEALRLQCERVADYVGRLLRRGGLLRRLKTLTMGLGLVLREWRRSLHQFWATHLDG